LLTAYDIPSGMTVHAIMADCAIGTEVKQNATIDGGIFAHQVRAFPSNKALILVTRGTTRLRRSPRIPVR
jgi:6-phosphogluconolactonase